MPKLEAALSKQYEDIQRNRDYKPMPGKPQSFMAAMKMQDAMGDPNEQMMELLTPHDHALLYALEKILLKVRPKTMGTSSC